MDIESRVTQIEKLLETCARMITKHEQGMEELREQTQRNAEHLASLFLMFEDSVQIMREMQAQVKGIQTENQRIISHLFGEEEN